jgi:hypothetical protein
MIHQTKFPKIGKGGKERKGIKINFNQQEEVNKELRSTVFPSPLETRTPSPSQEMRKMTMVPMVYRYPPLPHSVALQRNYYTCGDI